MKKLLFFLFLTPPIFFGALQVDTNVQTALLPESEKLKSTEILNYEQKDSYVEYLYPEKELTDLPNEIVERRTSDSRTVREGKKLAVYFDATNPYYEDKDGHWWSTSKATTTSSAFQLQTKQSIFGQLFGKIAHAQTFLTTGAGTGNQTWNVPNDWNSANNSIECIGAGGDGAAGVTNTATGAGGGGGAYGKITNLSLTAGGTATYAIGAHATTTGGTIANETFFNGTASTSASLSCAFGRFANGTTLGKGGTAAQSTGTTLNAGGDGCAGSSISLRGGSGGGGSGGPTGAGKGCTAASSGGGSGGGGSNGGSSTAGANTGGNTGGAGGAGTDGTGGGAGGSTTCTAGGDGTANKGAGGGGGGKPATGTGCNGGSGSVDQAFDSTHGAGGGGGGGSAGNTLATAGSGKDGGTYGGGAGGGGSSGTSGTGGGGGVGGQGVIVIIYTPVPINSGNKVPDLPTTWFNL